jgi:hypothetical protein
MRRSPSVVPKLIVTALAITTALMLPVPVAYAMPITFVADLTGANEVPPVASPGTGFATVVLDPTLQTLQVNATFSGLTSNTNAAHIHCCAPLGTNAGVATTVPAFPGFPLGVTSGSYSSIVFDLTQPTIYNPVFVTSQGGTIPLAEAALIAGIETGMTYLNIHTVINKGGEIRGQLEPVPEPATLLLFGTTMAGLGLARWRQRRRGHLES